MRGHWTDDELIAHLYGVGPENNHLADCPSCQARFSAMQNRRTMLASAPDLPDEKSEFEFFAAQRRKIYDKITERSTAWWTNALSPRWVTAVASVAILGGGLMVYEQQHHQNDFWQKHRTAQAKISDAQLADEVGTLAQDVEPQATAPLQELFDE